MSSGWIKLHRQIIDSDDWLHEQFTRGQAWVDMLLLANHAGNSIRVRGIILNIERGQLGWSEERLAKRWKWSRGKARRFFSELESKSVQRIVQQKNNVISVITILNYEKYQSCDTTDDTTDDTPNGHQTDTKRYTNKNDKKNKNDKNVRIIQTFYPPSLESCIDLFESKGSDKTEATKFWGHYESKGWKVGKERMKSLNGAIVGWIARNATSTIKTANTRETTQERINRENMERLKKMQHDEQLLFLGEQHD